MSNFSNIFILINIKYYTYASNMLREESNTFLRLPPYLNQKQIFLGNGKRTEKTIQANKHIYALVLYDNTVEEEPAFCWRTRTWNWKSLEKNDNNSEKTQT